MNMQHPYVLYSYYAKNTERLLAAIATTTATARSPSTHNGAVDVIKDEVTRPTLAY